MSDTTTTTPTTTTLEVGTWADDGNGWFHRQIGVKGGISHAEIFTLVTPKGDDSTQVAVWLDADEGLLLDTWAARDIGCLHIGGHDQVEDLTVWGSPEHLRQIGVALIGLAAQVDDYRYRGPLA